MGENVALVIRSHLVESVQVQLPHKRCVISVFEMFGKYLLGQLGDILDDEPVLFGDPLDRVSVFGVLCWGQGYVNNAVGVGQENRNFVQYFVLGLSLL